MTLEEFKNICEPLEDIAVKSINIPEFKCVDFDCYAKNDSYIFVVKYLSKISNKFRTIFLFSSNGTMIGIFGDAYMHHKTLKAIVDYLTLLGLPIDENLQPYIRDITRESSWY